ncbi:(2Fe-2S)-binding protein [Cystobacter ferrugineus]|uniref:(2Fe-2S)-binding protein n=1 Tax=Cystobacter ferrugineus TaxID=83449 RepID=A0A1L9B9Q5_9BACT|nr:(2Fe-2S)-binding protein [Cystobacter ferrugineus]OJH38979.1 (2Fe-2S)-binding protein [Cystobacter ferrugineus]
MADEIPLSLMINGTTRALTVAPERTLLDVLREDLRATGTRRGCDQGSCGACMVLVDGEPVFSCLSLAVTLRGRAITTIEGVDAGGELHPVQRALVEHGAVQCGFCMSGIVLTAKALLERNPHPTVEEIRHALGSNVCRCSGYVKVVEAIASLGKRPGEKASSEERS